MINVSFTKENFCSLCEYLRKVSEKSADILSELPFEYSSLDELVFPDECNLLNESTLPNESSLPDESGELNENCEINEIFIVRMNIDSSNFILILKPKLPNHIFIFEALERREDSAGFVPVIEKSVIFSLLNVYLFRIFSSLGLKVRMNIHHR